MGTLQRKPKQIVRGRGRPRLGDFRLETVLPGTVLDKLRQVESETGIRRTRIAANVLCEWAATK